MRKKLRFIFAFVALAIGIYFSSPKFGFDKKLNPNAEISTPSVDDNAESKFKDSPDESELDKFNNPVYYTLFKFILNASPFKTPEKIS